jgi:diaminopimelate epimerase
MIDYSKMDGNGNDFIIMNSLMSDLEPKKDFIQNISSRTNGVGCDQLILVCAPSNHETDFLIRFFNADGGEALMCLNGIRCASRYIWMHGFAPKNKMLLETKSKLILVEPKDNDAVSVKIDLPYLHKDLSLENALKNIVKKSFSLVNTGNLHLCIESENIADIKVEKIYKDLESIIKPHQINVSIFEKTNTGILVSTCENGVGKTLSCGSAQASVAFLNTVENESLKVSSEGGDLNFLRLDDKLIMDGPTKFSFNGVINE